MNGQSTVNHSTNNNEQLIGKFHVVNVDKLPINSVSIHDETTTAAAGQQQQPVAAAAALPLQLPPPATDESACASRFQMIRVDRNFGRGRWKVNDYEPPENISTSTNQPVNTIENEPVNISNASTLSTIPTTSIPANIPPGDPNATSLGAFAAAASAVPTATAFQQQQQQRLALNNPAAVLPTANVPPLLHPYPPGTLPNMAAPNQPYILSNHPQFGYYPFFPSHYSPYAAQWAALAAANHYLPPPPIPPHQQQASQLLTGNLGDAIRYTDIVPDATNENPVISSTHFPNPATDHLQNAQMAAPFIYAAHHPHSPYVSQAPPNTTSPYATIPSYHPAPQPPTIIPPSTQPLSLSHIIPNNTTDIHQQQSHQPPPSQQQAPILTSPKHDASSTKNSVQQSVAPKTTTTTTHPTQITDLLSSSPSISSSHPPHSLLSPITIQTSNSNRAPTTSLNEIWPYGASGSPLNLSQTAAQTAAATAVEAMGLLTNQSGKNAEIANEILKELTTPTKQNNLSERRARLRYKRQASTTDIDNKISAAMDLVKMHLLSAVREEVTELRQQIRTLNEKVNAVEHENVFLRQHVPSEIYAQYMPLFVGSSAANDSLNSMTTATTTAPTVLLSSSQPIPTASLSALPSSIAQQPSLSTNSQPIPPQPPLPSSINLPPT